MLQNLSSPVVHMRDGVLVRRSGLFYRQKIGLNEISRVTAINKDAITHEEIVVCFSDSSRIRVWLSEFDRNFDDVMTQLMAALPGMISPRELVVKKPFEPAELVLWERQKPRDTH